jgi:hypothetical protein
MLQALRTSLKTVIVWIFLGVLALGFGLSFGLPSDAITCGAEPIAKAYGNNILDEDYQYQFQAISLVLPIPRTRSSRRRWGSSRRCSTRSSSAACSPRSASAWAWPRSRRTPRS